MGLANRRVVFDNEDESPAGERHKDRSLAEINGFDEPMKRFQVGEPHRVRVGRSSGTWSHDGEGNVSIRTRNGEPAIVAAALSLALDQLIGDEPSLSIEDDHGRRAVFVLYPAVPSDALIETIPAAFARLPAGRGSWELTVDNGVWQATKTI